MVFYRDELREIDCIFLSSFFLTKSVKTGNGNFSILCHSYKTNFKGLYLKRYRPFQHLNLNLSFVKDIYGNVKKMAKRVVKW
jgi:hypothetical protein